MAQILLADSGLPLEFYGEVFDLTKAPLNYREARACPDADM